MLRAQAMTTRTEHPAEGSALERAEEAALPSIRPEAAEDIDVIADVRRAAFNGSDEAELVDAIRRSAHFIPDLSLVAELNGQVVGHVLLSSVELVTPHDGTLPLLALAPVAVSPLHQGRGIGTLLTRAALALADARSHEIGIAVLGAPNFYRRFGFVSADAEAISGPWKAAAGVFQVLPLTAAGEALPPGVVAYPAAFSLV